MRPPVTLAEAAAVARRHGHRPFLTFYDDRTGERTELSYATFDNWVAKAANFFVEELALSRGDRLAVVGETHWTLIVALFACWRAGVCAVPIGRREAEERGAAVLEESAAGTALVQEDVLDQFAPRGRGFAAERVVAVGTGLGGRLSEPRDDVDGFGEEVLAYADDFDDVDVSPDDEAWLGFPARDIAVTQAGMLAAASSFLGVLADGDRLLCTEPFDTFDGAALGLVAPFLAGGSVVVAPHLDAATFGDRVAQERVTLALVTQPVLAQLAPEHAVHLRGVVSRATGETGAGWQAAEELALADRPAFLLTPRP